MKQTFDQARVTVKQGVLQGTTEGNLKVFRGVPYAAPPLGDKRWKAPEAPARWFGVRMADRFSGGALQADGRAHWPSEDFELSAKMDSEDCLYLNIWTPAKTPDEKLPIFVWIHGGGMVAGTGMAPFFEGERLAAQGMMVVTINYRLGLFGFLCHPELTAEAPYGSSGNYAILDMRQALLWLHENADRFGGDAQRITVGGQSGGSVGTSCLLMSPLVSGLCSQVIMQSGCPLLGGMMDAKNRDEMEQDGVAFAEAVACKSIAELRAMDGCDLIEASLRVPYTPNYCIDGYVLPDSPYELFTSGRFNPMNFIVGFTTEEFGSFGVPHDIAITSEAFERYINKVFPSALAPELLAHYPHENSGEALKSLLRLLGDLMFLSAARLGVAGAQKGVASYVYYKSRPDAGERGQRLGSTHSSELPYLFGRTEPCIINPAGMDEAERAFGTQLMAYWVNFIKTGCPNGADTEVEWPRCEELFTHLDLGTTIHTATPQETAVLAQLNTMLTEKDERSTRAYMDTSELGYPSLFAPR